ncbi:hypothetical protein BESB_051950 [Besnoitia besnoiti]|uniref:Uncharacterized protein n=1 Tax=Besnoitia besnoiti TaxID=94643 RepID=A0A2A9MEC0_BESBE|nr:hypothetical protein BESB_051950 [Besnoitia besnoiti]PFH35544.1 hypothetical protein BESB_051950 [Besnoitia besnoiti]
MSCTAALDPPSASSSTCHWDPHGAVRPGLRRSPSAYEVIRCSSAQECSGFPSSSHWKQSAACTPENGCPDTLLFSDDTAAHSTRGHGTCARDAGEETDSAGLWVSSDLQCSKIIQSGKAVQRNSDNEDLHTVPQPTGAGAERPLLNHAIVRHARLTDGGSPRTGTSSETLRIASFPFDNVELHTWDGTWKKASPKWQHRAAPFGVAVHRKETGGGGDCMYHSIAACLEELAEIHPEFEALDMQAIRNAAADGFVGYRASKLRHEPPGPQWDANAFMERLAVLAALEDEEWSDSWSPSEVLTGDQYRNSAHMIMDTSTPEGKAAAVHFELSRPGSVHWGAGFDVEAIEDALNIGIIVLSHENGGIYPRASRTDVKRPYYVLIYYYSGEHFQQAGVRRLDEGDKGSRIRSAFGADEIPEFIRHVHSEDCRQPLIPAAKEQI